MKSKLKTVLSSLIKFCVAGGLLYWMASKGLLNLSSLTQIITLQNIGISLLMSALIIYINNFRWGLLLRSQGFPMGDRETLPLTFIGTFFNYAIPGGVGGDVVKGYYILRDYPQKRLAAGTSILLDRVVGLFGMAVMAMCMILLDLPHVWSRADLRILALAVTLLFVFLALFLGLSFSKRVHHNRFLNLIFEKIPGGKFGKKAFDALHSFGGDRKGRVVIIQTLLVSFLSQVFMILFFYFISSQMSHMNVPAIVYFTIVPLGLITTVLPISPGGIGVGQTAFYFLFKLYTGIDSDVPANAMTAYQVVFLLWGFVGLYFYLTRKKVY